MRSLSAKSLVLLMVGTLVLTPGLVQALFAQDDSDAAPQDQVQTLQQLAQKGYLGDKKDYYSAAKGLTDDDITDGLVKIYQALAQLDLSTLKPGDKTYQTGDLQALHQLVEDKREDILARKVSAWKFERRLEKMMALLDPKATPVATAQAAPMPTPTVTPVPGPSREELEELKGALKDLSKRTDDMREAFDQKTGALQKSNDELSRANEDFKAGDAQTQEQLKLVKKLLDQVQDDLKKMGDRLDMVAQKANEKNITDTELQQDLEVLHKDVRDNTQDVSILKQEVAKLDRSSEKAGQSPLDDLLASKWLAGGALAVGLTALVISLTRK